MEKKNNKKLKEQNNFFSVSFKLSLFIYPIMAKAKKGKNKISHSFDVMGNIALIKFPGNKKYSLKQKKKIAKELLEKHKAIKTVLEKTGKFKGRLRKQETRWLAGEKNKEVLYKENGCSFRFNIDKTYFSQRLAEERKEIADNINSKDRVLVMCAGIAPYSIVITKNSDPELVVNNEINREANKYARKNAELNKVQNNLKFFDGDIKKEAPKIREYLNKNNISGFDAIVMSRPQLNDSFLEEAFQKILNFLRKNKNNLGTRIYYYGFYHMDDIPSAVEMVKREARKAGRKVRINNLKKAGDIAPYRYRIRIDFEVIE